MAFGIPSSDQLNATITAALTQAGQLADHTADTLAAKLTAAITQEFAGLHAEEQEMAADIQRILAPLLERVDRLTAVLERFAALAERIDGLRIALGEPK